MSEKRKAVGYARYSSSNQREESISAQKRYILMYANQCNYEIIDWYIDEAKTGKTTLRAGFMKLVEDVKHNPEFDAVIVHKFDRFSRNVEDTLHYVDEFKDFGVKVLSVSEGIEDTPAGKMMLVIMSGVNQYYVDNLALEVMKGMRETALQGKWTGGPAPLGYDVVDGNLVINEKEAKSIKLIFEMSAAGYGYGQIIDRLNILGYKTKNGNKFGKNSLYDILKNERYKGTYIFNRRSSANSENKRNNHKYKPDSEIIRIENGCPAIVPKSLWMRANAVKRATRCSYTNARNPYLLTGLIYCKCGGKFHGNVRRNRKKGTQYTTYRCSKRINTRDCDCIEIRCEILDSWVIEQFFCHFFNDDNIPVITQKLNEQVHKIATNDTQYNEVKNNLKALIKSRDNLIEAIIQTGSNEAISAKINEYEKQIADSKKFIENYEKYNIERVITEDEVRDKIIQLREYMENPENLVKTKYILSQYIERVDISNEEVKVTFKVAFALHNDDSSEIPTYFHSQTIRRKDLIKNYQHIENIIKSNDKKHGFIEILRFCYPEREFLWHCSTRKSHDCIYNRDFYGGGEENRTPVQKSLTIAFYGCSLSITFPRDAADKQAASRSIL